MIKLLWFQNFDLGIILMGNSTKMQSLGTFSYGYNICNLHGENLPIKNITIIEMRITSSIIQNLEKCQ